MTGDEFRDTYERYLDDDTRSKLDTLSEPDKAYFWAYLAEVLPTRIAKEELDSMEHEIGRRVTADTPVAKPFTHAEQSVEPGRWFSSPLRVIEGGCR